MGTSGAEQPPLGGGGRAGQAPEAVRVGSCQGHMAQRHSKEMGADAGLRGCPHLRMQLWVAAVPGARARARPGMCVPAGAAWSGPGAQEKPVAERTAGGRRRAEGGGQKGCCRQGLILAEGAEPMDGHNDRWGPGQAPAPWREAGVTPGPVAPTLGAAGCVGLLSEKRIHCPVSLNNYCVAPLSRLPVLTREGAHGVPEQNGRYALEFR